MGKTLYHKFFEGETVGEAEGFFELSHSPLKLKLITCWSNNDACWREEYMNGLIRYFGGTIKQLPEKYVDKAAQLIADSWGL